MIIRKSYAEHCINQIDKAIERALTRLGEDISEDASNCAPVDTGNLRNSINYNVRDDSLVVGTNEEYGIYVELGTGVYASGGRKTPWTYQDSHGEWHITNGQRAQPFLKPALDNNKSRIPGVFKREFDKMR